MHESPVIGHPAMQSIPTRDFELMFEKLLGATDPVHDDALVENLASLLQGMLSVESMYTHNNYGYQMIMIGF